MGTLDPKKDEFFRANVGIIVVDAERKVLALRRVGHSGQWQLPQGGLERGDESPRHAAERELREETGIAADGLEFLAEHPRWLSYELPVDYRSLKTGRGQTQKWFLFRCRSGRPEIDLGEAKSREFDDFKWSPFSEIVAGVVSFRKPVYERLKEDFTDYLG